MRPPNRVFGNSLDSLESPFLDEEIFRRDPDRKLDSAERDDTRRADEETETETDEETAFGPEGFDDHEEAFASVEEPYLEAPEGSELESLGEDWEAEAVEDRAEAEEEADFQEAESDEEVENEATRDLAPADTIDEAAAQPAFPKAVSDRLGPLLEAKRAREASKWNAARHPTKSGIAAAALLPRLGRYVNNSAVQKAMQDSEGLKHLSRDDQVVLAVVAHQFQQKIYAATALWDGRIGEGTLDALGFTRHRDAALNPVDALNIAFHVKRRSKAYKRLKELYKTDRRAFEDLGAEVSPKTWYSLFVNAPFLGRPFIRGIHLELMRRLRLAEKWLLAQPQYRDMSPVELAAALGIDEDHRGGRPTNNNSMHTLGLAVDIRYNKNPWVAGQHGSEGKPNRNRNGAFQAVTQNVSRLLSGTEEVLTPAWLKSLSSSPGQTTASAYGEIQQRQTNLQAFLALENDPDGLKAIIEQRRQGPHAGRVIKPQETIDAALRRWRATIKEDRGKLRTAFGAARTPAAGFLNLHRDLVIALRDHGCLAWGAIDLGANANGDMMHFDCRATGIGWKLSLEKQRTAGAAHPCVSEKKALEELETPPAIPGASTPAAFRGGRVWTFTARTLPLRVAVFCPKVVSSPKTLDVLVYAHGHLAPCPPVPKTMPEDIITKAPFELGKIVDASNRQIALVVPFMDWANLRKNKLNFEACNRDSMHLLGTPANLNGVVREVLAEVGRVYGTAPPSIPRLILAGHSRAFDFLNPLALGHVDPEMSKGALAALSQIWMLDTTYVCFIAEWMRWLNAKPGLRISVFYRPGTGTAKCGRKFEAVVASSGARLTVIPVREGHCQVPARRLPGLLSPSATPVSPEIGEELNEEMDQQLDEELDEQLDEEREDVSDEAFDGAAPSDGETLDEEETDAESTLDDETDDAFASEEDESVDESAN